MTGQQYGDTVQREERQPRPLGGILWCGHWAPVMGGKWPLLPDKPRQAGSVEFCPKCCALTGIRRVNVRKPLVAAPPSGSQEADDA